MHIPSKFDSSENVTPENDLLIENESDHIKVFSFPTRKNLSKKFIAGSIVSLAFIVFAIFGLLIAGGVIWETPFNRPEDIGKYQHQRTVTTRKIKDNKSDLLNYIRQISGFKTISGIFMYTTGVSSNESIEIYQRIAGVTPGIISTSIPNSNAYEAQWNAFINEVIFNWKTQHLVRIVWWSPQSPLEWIHNFTYTRPLYDMEMRWRDLIKEGGALNNLWKRQLDIIAPYLRKLQTAGVITVLDILPNMNDRLYMWRGRPGTNGTAKLYKITHEYLTKQHNLTSLIWTWSVYSGDMSKIEEFWPGSEYVDVVSVYMQYRTELPTADYYRLVHLVGDKPVSMEGLRTVPNLALLTVQPRWIWFTAYAEGLQSTYNTNASNIEAALHSTSFINRGKIDFFNDRN